MKNIIISGRLVADPNVSQVGEKNTKVANFRIANNDGDKDNGEFYDVKAWEYLAEFSENYLKKGVKILIQGSFNNEGYQDKEGKNKTHFSITAQKIEFLQ